MLPKTIIDFHTHCIDKNCSIFLERNIDTRIVIPFEQIPNYQYITNIPIRKPTHWQKWLKYDLTRCNETWHNIINMNMERMDDVILVPWVSALNSAEFLNEQFPWILQSKLIKFIPVYDDYQTILSPQSSHERNYVLNMIQILKQTKSKGVMIHTGWQPSFLPSYYEELISQFPDKIFVLAHLKEDIDQFNTDRLHLVKSYPNVYLETSYYSSPKRITQYIAYGLEDRLLFGSDWRTSADTVSLDWQLNGIQLATITDKQIYKILYLNAHKLLEIL